MQDKPKSPFEHLPRRVLFADVAEPKPERARRPEVTPALAAKVRGAPAKTRKPTAKAPAKKRRAKGRKARQDARPCPSLTLPRKDSAAAWRSVPGPLQAGTI